MWLHERCQGRIHSLKSQCMETSVLAMPCSTQVIFYSVIFHVKAFMIFVKAKLFYLKLFTQTQCGYSYSYNYSINESASMHRIQLAKLEKLA